MKSICHFCQGESHKATGKPCQDFAHAEASTNLSMAIVSDGHGGERYFRSDRGSRFLVEITKQSIISFVENMKDSTFVTKGESSIFDGAPFTDYMFNSSSVNGSNKTSRANDALQWLFSSIISQWNIAINNDAVQNDLTEWEKEHVEKKYQDEFIAKRADENATFEKTYGCTLIAYVQTNSYWFAFQLGDGKSVFINKKGNGIVCEQLIPWDEKCFLNKTTSICDSNALQEIRYCYQGDGHFPIAVFNGSDGLDDTYGDGDKLYDFYIRIYKQIAKSGLADTEEMLRKSLPEISRIGSKDDMSVAAIFDDQNIRENFYLLSQHQEEALKEEIDACCMKLGQISDKISGFEDKRLSQAEQIELNYAEKDLEKWKSIHKKLRAKMNELMQEIERFNRGNSKVRNSKPSKRANTLADLMKNKS